MFTKELMQPWLKLWNLDLLSGDVTQDVNWFSPELAINFAGNKRIESKVVSDIASYGKQLGLLTEAVLELASNEQGEAIDALRSLSDKINAVKENYHNNSFDRLKSELDELKSNNEDSFNELIRQVTSN